MEHASRTMTGKDMNTMYECIKILKFGIFPLKLKMNSKRRIEGRFKPDLKDVCHRFVIDLTEERGITIINPV